MADKYNYKSALQLLIDKHNNNQRATYKEVQMALGLEKPIEDKAAATTNNSILFELRKRLKQNYGLTFKSAANGNHCGPDYYYYTISPVKDGPKKKVNDFSNVQKTVNYDALSKDNQKLYAEVQELKLQNRNLLEMISVAGSKEEHYKSIINSLMSIAEIV